MEILRMSLHGPKRQLAAAQRYGRCRWNTGRSVDAADTAAADPQRDIEFTLVISLTSLHRVVDNTMLRQLNLADMNEAATVLRRSFDHALPTLAGLHTPEEDRWFFRERVFTTCQLWGYLDDNELIGIIAFREGWIDHLYVLPSSQGRGVGTALLQVAQGFHGNLELMDLPAECGRAPLLRATRFSPHQRDRWL